MSIIEELEKRTVSEDTSEVVAASEVDWDVDTNVLVAGAGACGLTASLTVAENTDLQVTMLEKDDEIGGNMRLAVGSIPAAGTRIQEDAGIEDSPENMVREIMEKANYEADEEMVRILAEESRHLISWLLDEVGLELALVTDYLHPRKDTYRVHSHPEREGPFLVEALGRNVEATDNIELLTNTPVRKLVEEGGEVVGVVAGMKRTEAIRAEKTILATDGFGQNKQMLREQIDETVAELYYNGAAGNTGDGIRWADELGAELSCMDAYSGYAFMMDVGVFFNYAHLMHGGIMINENGERFADESKGYSAFVDDVLDQPGGVAYGIGDGRTNELLLNNFGGYEDEVQHYATGDTVEELAEELGIPPETTAETVERYNEQVKSGGIADFNRTERLHELDSPPYYGAQVQPALFFTQGGVVIDEHTRVQRPEGSTIGNLYAGGGVAVGISGHGAAGYSSGNGLLTALGHGRLAGKHVREVL